MPAPMAVMAGAGASFSVVAAGLPTPTLQWQRRLPRGAWEDVAGATGATYNLAATTLAQDGTQFRVVATNASGSVSSALATLNVVDQASPPAITAVSGPLTVTRTGTAVFAATVKGTEPLSFQWRRDGVDVLGANSPILRLDQIGDGHAGNYVLHVSNPAGAVQAVAQQLTVVAEGSTLPTAPAIVTQPVAVRVNAGNTATFAVGAGGSGPLAYQWKRDNVDIPGATAAFYSIAAAAPGDAATYAVVVSNSAGSATSANAVLTVDAAVQPQAPVITAQPGAVVVVPGMSALLGVGVQGSGPMSFQWLKNGVAVAGQTQATYAIAAASALDAGAYQVRVSNGVGEVTSATAQVILLGAPAIVTQPSNKSVTEGASATFSVTASGDHLGYQWTRNQVAIAGATGTSYTTPALALADSGAVYAVIAYNGAGVAISSGAVLTVSRPAGRQGMGDRGADRDRQRRQRRERAGRREYERRGGGRVAAAGQHVDQHPRRPLFPGHRLAHPGADRHRTGNVATAGGGHRRPGQRLRRVAPIGGLEQQRLGPALHRAGRLGQPGADRERPRRRRQSAGRDRRQRQCDRGLLAAGRRARQHRRQPLRERYGMGHGHRDRGRQHRRHRRTADRHGCGRQCHGGLGMGERRPALRLQRLGQPVHRRAPAGAARARSTASTPRTPTRTRTSRSMAPATPSRYGIGPTARGTASGRAATSSAAAGVRPG